MDDHSKRRKQEISIIRIRKITLYQWETLHILKQTEKQMKQNTKEITFYKEQIVQFFLSMYFPAAQH